MASPHDRSLSVLARLVFALACLCMTTGPARAQMSSPPLLNAGQLLGPGPGYGRSNSLAVQGDTLVAGVALSIAQPGMARTQAHVVERTPSGDWQVTAVLEAPVAVSAAWPAVAIDGDTVLLGVNNTPAAGVHVFVRQGAGWIHQAELLPPPGAESEAFSYDVDLSGDVAVVGGFADGRAWVFERSGTSWSAPIELVPDGSLMPGGFRFGDSVAVCGRWIAVGASDALEFQMPDGSLGAAGAVCLYERHATGWELAQILFGDEVDMFLGWSVDLEGDTLVAGAGRGDSPAGVDTGSARVWRRHGDTWTADASLFPGPVQQAPLFGASVSVSGDLIVVGSPGWFFGPGNSNAFVYQRRDGTWSLTHQLGSTDSGNLEEFGRVVACADGRVFVGSLGWSTSPYVALFDELDDQPAWFDLGGGLPGGTPVAPIQWVHGSLLPGSKLLLEAFTGVANTPTWLVIGASRADLPFAGGVLVPAPTAIVAPSITSGSLVSYQQTWPDTLPPGLHRLWFQWWTVDPSGPAGWSATNAVMAFVP